MEKLKELRKNKNMSQSELAKIMCIAQNTLSAYERGMRDPDTEILLKFADFFEVSIDYLLGRVSEEQKEKPTADDSELEKLLNEPYVKEILDKLNKLDPDYKILADSQLDALLKHQETSKK